MTSDFAGVTALSSLANPSTTTTFSYNGATIVSNAQHITATAGTITTSGTIAVTQSYGPVVSSSYSLASYAAHTSYASISQSNYSGSFTIASSTCYGFSVYMSGSTLVATGPDGAGSCSVTIGGGNGNVSSPISITSYAITYTVGEHCGPGSGCAYAVGINWHPSLSLTGAFYNDGSDGGQYPLQYYVAAGSSPGCYISPSGYVPYGTMATVGASSYNSTCYYAVYGVDAAGYVLPQTETGSHFYQDIGQGPYYFITQAQPGTTFLKIAIYYQAVYTGSPPIP